MSQEKTKYSKELITSLSKTRSIAAESANRKMSPEEMDSIKSNFLDKNHFGALQELMSLKREGDKNEGIYKNKALTLSEALQTYCGLDTKQLLSVFGCNTNDTLADIANSVMGKRGASVTGQFIADCLKSANEASFNQNWSEGTAVSNDILRWIVSEILIEPISVGIRVGGNWRDYVNIQEPLLADQVSPNSKARVRYVKSRGRIFQSMKEGDKVKTSSLEYAEKEVPVEQMRAKFAIQTSMLASLTLNMYLTHSNMAIQDLNYQKMKKVITTLLAGDIAGEDISTVGLKEAGKLRKNDIAGLLGAMQSAGVMVDKIFYNGEVNAIDLNDSIGSAGQVLLSETDFKVPQSIVTAPNDYVFLMQTANCLGYRESEGIQITTDKDEDTDTSFLYMKQSNVMFIMDRLNCAAVDLAGTFTAYPNEYVVTF